MIQSPRDKPQNSSRFRDTVLIIAKGLYFTHLFLSGIFAGVLLII